MEITYASVLKQYLSAMQNNSLSAFKEMMISLAQLRVAKGLDEPNNLTQQRLTNSRITFKEVDDLVFNSPEVQSDPVTKKLVDEIYQFIEKYKN